MSAPPVISDVQIHVDRLLDERVAQGLPRLCSDPSILARLATLIAPLLDDVTKPEQFDVAA